MHQPLIPHVASTDPEVAGLIESEAERQFEKVRLIPSENYVARPPTSPSTWRSCSPATP